MAATIAARSFVKLKAMFSNYVNAINISQIILTFVQISDLEFLRGPDHEKGHILQIGEDGGHV